MSGGLALHSDGSTGDAGTHLNGYTIIQAESISDAVTIAKDHPYLAAGHEYSIEVYSLL